MAKGLLGMFQPQPNAFQTLLGEYYDPRQAKMQWIGGTLQGLGMGLATGRPGAWAEGAIAGGTEGAQNYRQQALAQYALKQRQDEEAYQRERDQTQWDYRVGRDEVSDAQWAAEQKRIAQSQAGGGSAGWGMNPIPMKNRKTGEIVIGQFNQGQGGVFVNGQPANPDEWSYDPYAVNQQKAAGTEVGRQQGGAAAAIPGAQIDVNAINAKIDSLINNPNLPDAIGYGNVVGDYFTSNGVLSVRSDLNTLKGDAFLSAYSALRGGGAITEIESAQAQQSMTDMETARKMSDPEMFKAALEKFRDAINRGFAKLQANAGQFAPGDPAAPATGGAPSGKTSSGVPWSLE